MRHPFSRQVLMTPGPVEENQEDRLAGLAMRLHHRTAEFQEVFLRVHEGMQWLLGTKARVALLTASGSGGLEAAVANMVSPGEPVVVVSAGKFGQRWQKLAVTYGAEVSVIEKEPGQAATPDELAARVAAVDARVAFTTLQETSTGVWHDIEGFGKALTGSGCLLVVDAVSGLACLPFEMDAWGVDVTVSGSQKGLLAPPGLAMVAWSDAAEERRAHVKQPRFYFDLASYAKKPERAPFTPPVTLVAQVDAVLARLRQVGKQAVFEAVAGAGRAALAGGAALGLEPLSGEEDRSPALTTLRLPAAVDGVCLLADALAYSGAKMAGGQDQLKGRIVRIGHMGATTLGDLLGCFAGLEHGLSLQGHPVEVGAAVAAVARTYREGGAA